METKRKKTNPLRLARRKYAIKVEVPVGEPVAVAVEAGVKQDREERGVQWNTALDALSHRIQHAVDLEVDALELAGKEIQAIQEQQKSDAERVRAAARVEKLRAELEAAERKLGLHQDPVVQAYDLDIHGDDI